MPTRGFVTIATGHERYYMMAVRLLRSYRKYASDDTPFAIICDRENSFTEEFDLSVRMEQPNCSYMDKLLLYRYAPYDETIFIDADALVLSDPAGIWKDFGDADDFSCYGCTYPLDSDRAWFTYEGCGKYKSEIQFLIDLHGGIYYLRKTGRCRSIFEKAIELAGEYGQYGFRNFEKPADEPVLAMSMAIHHCRPCDKPMRVLFVPSYRGKLRVNSKGELFVSGKRRDVEVLHFATANTELFLYRYLADGIDENDRQGGAFARLSRYIRIWLLSLPKECKMTLRHAGGWILRKLFPASVVSRLKEKN